MRLLVEARPMRHDSVHVRVSVLNGADSSTKTGVGHLHVKLAWWARLRHVLRAGCQMDALPLDLEDGTEPTPDVTDLS